MSRTKEIFRPQACHLFTDKYAHIITYYLLSFYAADFFLADVTRRPCVISSYCFSDGPTGAVFFLYFFFFQRTWIEIFYSKPACFLHHYFPQVVSSSLTQFLSRFSHSVGLYVSVPLVSPRVRPSPGYFLLVPFCLSAGVAVSRLARFLILHKVNIGEMRNRPSNINAKNFNVFQKFLTQIFFFFFNFLV